MRITFHQPMTMKLPPRDRRRADALNAPPGSRWRSARTASWKTKRSRPRHARDRLPQQQAWPPASAAGSFPGIAGRAPPGPGFLVYWRRTGLSALGRWAGWRRPLSMFVAHELTVDAGPGAAQARFVNMLRGNWLAEASGAAYDGGLTGLLRAGLAGPVAAKLVRVRCLDPLYRGDVMTVGLRWEATGPAGSLFPVLDADISISRRGTERPRSRAIGPAGAEGDLPAAAGPAGSRAGSGGAAPGGHSDDARPAAQRCPGDHQSCHRRPGRGRNQAWLAPNSGDRVALKEPVPGRVRRPTSWPCSGPGCPAVRASALPSASTSSPATAWLVIAAILALCVLMLVFRPRPDLGPGTWPCELPTRAAVGADQQGAKSTPRQQLRARVPRRGADLAPVRRPAASPHPARSWAAGPGRRAPLGHNEPVGPLPHPRRQSWAHRWCISRSSARTARR
jgi:hypothetical protein